MSLVFADRLTIFLGLSFTRPRFSCLSRTCPECTSLGNQPTETTQCLKYMLLAKVMNLMSEEVEAIANSKMSVTVGGLLLFCVIVTLLF